MINNPILPGLHADPCICRKGDDFYVAVSSFEWFPGIPIYHSKDMKNWELYSHALTNADDSDLKKLPSAKGIWAPHLTKHGDYYYIMAELRRQVPIFGLNTKFSAFWFGNRYMIFS